MQQRIEFTRGGSNTIVGNFEPGMILRCDGALARHFIEIGVARALDAPPKPEPRKRGRK